MWQVLKIPASAADADKLSDALLELGALSASIEDAQAGTADEQIIFGEPGMPSESWNDSLVSAMFAAEIDLPPLVAQAARAAGMAVTPVFHIDRLAEQDWVRLTQSQFTPIQISSRLWIVPSWHAAPDPAATVLTLDPGLAFGTGSHPTTRLCLQWLERNVGGGETLLDYGCGSGILAIAAKKFGATAVVGVDIDPQAISAAQDNAQRNAVDVQFYLPARAPEAQYAIVIANILSNPLRVLAPMLAARVCVGGRIALSGILAEQAQDMRTLYGEWFRMDAPVIDEGWACLSGVKQ